MIGGSLLLLLDDIATTLDDVALMTKVAAAKTAGVLGDDLALNAKQLSGVAPDRELRVVWAVARGSLRNKVILVPGALMLSLLAPTLVLPLLVVGGAYLCYEGAEKLVHPLLTSRSRSLPTPRLTEKERIDGAVRTDFILSAEIIVIALGTVEHATLPTRVAVLAVVGVLMTVGVYGLVAAIVKLDDAGLFLCRTTRPGPAADTRRAIGRCLVGAAPILLRVLAVAGTAAMFLVGGGIVVHGIEPIRRLTDSGVAAAVEHSALAGPVIWVLSMLFTAGTGFLVGAFALILVSTAKLLRKRV